MKMDKAVRCLSPMSVEAVEAAMLKQEQVKCDVIHRFGPGTYIREVHIPADTLAIGHKQNFEHTNIMLKGRVTMLNDDGSTVEFKAPMIFTGKPGRKIGYIHEDMVWLNVYPNIEGVQDISALENKFLTKSEIFKLADEQRDLLLLSSRSDDQKDFERALLDIGVTKEVVLKQSTNTDDLIDLPHGGFKTKIAKSKIDGLGIIATGEFTRGEFIGPARINGRRTIFGRYTNHSARPNAKFVDAGNKNIDLVAIDKIFGCRGGFDGDEITVDYREAVKLNLEIART